MRKLTYHVASTLDGFIADAQDDVAAFPHHGDHVDEYLATLRTYDTIVMGRRTYEFGLRLGVTDPYPWAEAYVVSSSMTTSPDPHVQITSEDARDLVRRLKSRDGGPVYPWSTWSSTTTLRPSPTRGGAIYTYALRSPAKLTKRPDLASITDAIDMAGTQPAHLSLFQYADDARQAPVAQAELTVGAPAPSTTPGPSCGRRTRSWSRSRGLVRLRPLCTSERTPGHLPWWPGSARRPS